MYTLIIENLNANEPVESITITDRQWSIAANFMHVVDATFFREGMLEQSSFPQLRRLLVRTINSDLMMHFFNVGLQHDGKQMLQTILDLVVKASGKDRPIIWQHSEPGIFEEPVRLKLEAGSYVIGDLRSIVDVSVPDTVLADPAIFECGDRFVYSYPVASHQYNYFDADDKSYSVSSSFAIVPRCLAKEKFEGRVLNITGDFEVWFENRVLHIEHLTIDLNPHFELEEICK